MQSLSTSYILFHKRATSSGSIPIVSNYTYKGRIISDAGTLLTVEYLTDEYGHDISQQHLRSYILKSDLLSMGTTIDINLSRIYSQSARPQAKGYVIKTRTYQAIMKSTDTGLGAGVYGVYLSPDMSKSDRYALKFDNPVILVDGFHGETLTLATRSLNIYLDRVLETSKQLNSDELRQIIAKTLPYNVFQLWDIFWSRTPEQRFTWNYLQECCWLYVMNYYNSVEAIDTITGNPLQKPPINLIFHQLGYDGVVAADRENNRRDRGCVSYSTDNIAYHYGATSKY